jgi:hypothetical protein
MKVIPTRNKQIPRESQICAWSKENTGNHAEMKVIPTRSK